MTDSACGSGKETTLNYAYDEHGDVVSVSYSGYRTGKFSQEKDSEGYVAKTVYEKDIGETQQYSYLYEKYGNISGNRVPNAPLTKLYLPTSRKIKYVYDSLNRLTEKGLVSEADEFFAELYSYEKGGFHEKTGKGKLCGSDVTTIESDRDTTFVSEVEFRGLNLTDKYEYDENGNIKKRIIINFNVILSHDLIKFIKFFIIPIDNY